MKFCPVCGTEYADEVKFCPRDGQTLRASDPTGDFVGQVIADRYHITRKLGEGGMGAVYLAEHVKMGRMSAIKVMGRGMSNDPEAISRFNREAANASRINHPNVCAVYDFGETEDGTIYLAMEYIEGRTLSSLLKESGPLPLRRAADLLRQAADALAAAHELGIVHRDLKPDNIMIVAQRGRDVVKVVDFGIAKAAEGEAGQKVTKTGLVVGTPEYMSPEQLSGDKLDGRSDIYSLALVFYRMITGTLPFVADTAQETMIKRLTDEPMPLAQARPEGGFPPGLQPVMDKALARWPADRYGSAVEFAGDVQRVAEQTPATAAYTSADTEAKTQMVRPEEMKTSRTAAPPPTRVSTPARSKLGPAVIGAGVVVLALAGGTFLMRDTLFGGGVPLDSLANLSNDSVAPLSQQTLTSADTSQGTGPAVPADTPLTRQRQTGPATTPPDTPVRTVSAPDTTARTPAGPSVAELASRVSEFERDLEFVDDPARRREGEALGRQVYNDSRFATNTRADAAYLVYAALLQTASETSNDAKRAEAREWLEKAIALNPKPIWRNLMQGL